VETRLAAGRPRLAGRLPRLLRAMTWGLALAASQALRRLDGEGKRSTRDCTAYPPTIPSFATSISRSRRGRRRSAWRFQAASMARRSSALAGSQYVPLREAAARFDCVAVCAAARGRRAFDCVAGTQGKGHGKKKLARDASPLVRAAAERTLLAWSKGEPVKRHWINTPNDGSRPWWRLPPPQPEGRRRAACKPPRDHDTIWRLLGRRLTYRGNPEAIRVMIDYGKSGAKWSSMSSRPLAEWGRRTGGGRVAKGGGPLVYSEYGGQSGLGALGPERPCKTVSNLPNRCVRPWKTRAHWSAPPEYTARVWRLASTLRTSCLPGWKRAATGGVPGARIHRRAESSRGARRASGAQGSRRKPSPPPRDSAIAAPRPASPPLIAQLKHEDRLRRHWAVLGLAKIGGPDAV